MALVLLLTSFISILLTLLFLVSFWKQQKRYRNLPPGPPPMPLLGNPFYLTKNAASRYYPELSKKYGPAFTLWKMRSPTVVLCGYEVVKDALVNHGEEFSGRPKYPTQDVYSGGYSFLSASLTWRPFRRFILSSLRNAGVGRKIMEDRVLEEADSLIQATAKKAGQPFDPMHVLTLAVTNIMSSIVFGEKCEYQDKKLHHLIQTTRRHSSNIRSMFHEICNLFPVLLKLPTIKDKLCKEVGELGTLVQDQVHFHEHALDHSNPRDFTDYFLLKMKEEPGAGSIFNKLSLQMLTNSLLVGAMDTTPTTLKFFLVLMAHLPHIQEKVQREIDEVVGPQRLPGVTDRAQLPYTNAVIHECQRVLDLAPISHYHVLTTDTQFRGFTLPKGTRVIPFLSSVLTDPTQWETPEEFNPGHFLDDEGLFLTKSAFMVFSAGKRACLGEPLARLELFLFFSALLQRFTFRLPPGSEPYDLKSLKSRKAALIGTAELCAVPRSVVSN
ncbi:cytochrome P450 2C37-like [Spea bombifrons]|uniref:cytochrome P450 2C37-like n=1 Tax=Spea bombifrons TaxID=233779 RepID=UPI0023490831|nr:cytochrome P450 2C37-like [Spea bombifrons]